MGTIAETVWVSDQAQLQATVQTLVAQGGVVQQQSEGQAQVHLKKKINVVALVVGLILCLVPGIAYLIWYTTADQNQEITVQVGQPGSIRTEHEHWYDEEAADGAVPGSTPPAPGAPPTSTPPAEPPGAEVPLAPSPEAYNPAPPAPPIDAPTYDMPSTYEPPPPPPAAPAS